MQEMRSDKQRRGSIFLTVTLAMLLAACSKSTQKTSDSTSAAPPAKPSLTGYADSGKACTKANPSPCPLPKGSLGKLDSAQVQALLSAYDFEDDPYSAHDARAGCGGTCKVKIKVRPEKRAQELDELSIKPNDLPVLIGLVTVEHPTPNSKDVADEFGIKGNEQALWLVWRNKDAALQHYFVSTSDLTRPLTGYRTFQRCDSAGPQPDKKSKASFVPKKCTAAPIGFRNPPPLWVTCKNGCCTGTL